jgi:transcriptional regulator with PAS, ATPase and Fis domain
LENISRRRAAGALPPELDFRFIATASQPLEPLIREGKFREDLYYRISVIPLTIPPLRDRREDIPPLVHHFMVRAAARMKKDVSAVSRDAMSALMNYEWPGNVRELEHAVERAVIVANTASVGRRDLPPEISQKTRVRRGDDTLDLQEQERASIERALERFGGNRRKAASALKISTVTLWRKMKQYGLST